MIVFIFVYLIRLKLRLDALDVQVVQDLHEHALPQQRVHLQSPNYSMRLSYMCVVICV